MPTNYHAKNPRGQQRDKIYREALRLELADMSEGIDLKKLREIARMHIEKAAAGDMQAIKELADRLDGRPAQILEHSGPSPDSEPITKIVNEIVHVHETREELLAAEEPVLIEWSGVRDANGSGGPNEDTARTSATGGPSILPK
jgi:hypothetical protein